MPNTTASFRRDRREPLSNSTNSLGSSRDSASHDATGKPTPVVRRKVSFRKLNPRSDSSEETPSEHSSVFEALYCESSDGGDGGEKAENYGPGISTHNRERSSNARQITNSNTSSTVGLGLRDKWTTLGGTPLETIIERKSANTLKSTQSFTRTYSLDETSPLTFEPLAEAKQARRKQSFSVNDVVLLDPVVIHVNEEDATSRPTPPPKVRPDYARPNEPIHDRPERVPTPPGMPSWSAAPATPRQVPQSPQRSIGSSGSGSRRWRFPFRSSSQRSASPSGLSVVETPDGIRISSPRRNVTAPTGQSRFRPPASGYRSYGSLDQHPFSRAPVAEVWDCATQPGVLRNRLPRGEASPLPSVNEGNRGRRVHFTHSVSGLASVQGATMETRPTNDNIGAANLPSSCPHGQKRQRNGQYPEASAAANSPVNGCIEQQLSSEEGLKSCWRCNVNRFFRPVFAVCCGNAKDYHNEIDDGNIV